MAKNNSPEYMVDASLYIMESRNSSINTTLFTKNAQFMPFESSRIIPNYKTSNHVKRHDHYSAVFDQDWTARPRPLVRTGIVSSAFQTTTLTPPSIANFYNYGQRLPKYIPPSNEPQLLHSNEILIGQSTPEINTKNSFAFFNHTALMDLFEKTDALGVANQTDITRTTSSKSTSCTPDQFRCDSGHCISSHNVCNRKRDCIDGSDEKNCKCIDYFRALNFDQKICDGIIDCWDFTDETNCTWCNTKNSYICPGSKTCIPITQVCDGSFDCPDGSDEEACVALIPESKIESYDQILKPNSRTLNNHGVLFVQKRGKWAPFCLNTLHNSESDAELHWRTEDLGRAVCVAQSYQGMTSVKVITHQFQNFNHFYQLNDPYNMFKSSTKWSLLFQSSDCNERKMISIDCKDFGNAYCNTFVSILFLIAVLLI